MSTQTGSTPAESGELPADPEAVVDEIAEPEAEDYDPQGSVDPDREATEADMIEQSVEVPQEDEEGAEADEDLA